MSYNLRIKVCAFQWKGEQTEEMYLFSSSYPEITYSQTREHTLRTKYDVLVIDVPLGYYLVIPEDDIHSRFCIPYRVFRKYAKPIGSNGIQYELNLFDLKLFAGQDIKRNPPKILIENIDINGQFELDKHKMFCCKRFMPVLKSIMLWVGTDYVFTTTLRFAQKMCMDNKLFAYTSDTEQEDVPYLLMVKSDSLVSQREFDNSGSNNPIRASALGTGMKPFLLWDQVRQITKASNESSTSTNHDSNPFASTNATSNIFSNSEQSDGEMSNFIIKRKDISYHDDALLEDKVGRVLRNDMEGRYYSEVADLKDNRVVNHIVSRFISSHISDINSDNEISAKDFKLFVEYILDGISKIVRKSTYTQVDGYLIVMVIKDFKFRIYYSKSLGLFWIFT